MISVICPQTIKAVLFDLDGTLLPFHLDQFFVRYFPALSKHTHRLAKQDLMMGWIESSVRDVLKSTDASTTCAQVFWNSFECNSGLTYDICEPLFMEYYQTKYDELCDVVGTEPIANQLVQLVKSTGRQIILATSPLYPAIAIHKRMQWGGLNPKDFDLITHYDNSHFSKPNTQYYQEIINTLGLQPHEVLMVGNDLGDDILPCEKLGIPTFYLDVYPENVTGIQGNYTNRGNYQDLIEFLEPLCSKI